MALEDETVTVDETGADDAFASGFEGKTPKAPPQQQPVTDKPPPDEAPKDDAPEYVQLTKQELAELKAAAAKTASYDKQFSTVFGTVGRFEKLVRDVQQAQQDATGKASAAALEKLREQFPEVADAMQGVMAQRATPPAETPEEHAARVATELQILTDEYPDWRTMMNAVNAASGEEPDPEHPFRKWLATKSEAYQRMANTTESSADLVRILNRFQAETATKPVVQPKPAARAEDKRAQIAAAVQPKGDGAPPSSSRNEDDAFLAGFTTRR